MTRQLLRPPSAKLTRVLRLSILLLIVATLAAVGSARWWETVADDVLAATVRRETLVPRLTVSGVLTTAQSITYHSPLGGRETEVTFLVDEGTLVNEGDLLVRLDTTDLDRDLARANQELRQARVDLQVAEIDWQEGQAAIESLSEGEGTLSLDETRVHLQLAEKRVERLREAYDALRPLMEKGFVTREELRKTGDELQQAEEELALSGRKSEVLLQHTYPRDRKKAELQLAQKEAQRENVRARLLEAQARVAALREQVEGSRVYAQRPGLVVYNEYLGANPRRKLRVGDRATGSQGLVTIPDVSRMLVEASVSEADVYRVRPGQAAVIRLEAFPERPLQGTVIRVGTLAQSSTDRPLDGKRFELVVEVGTTAADLRPEMTARVDVLLGDRPNALLVPINAVFGRSGLPVAYVLGRSGVETRVLRVGESSDTDVEVIAGLAEGERVTLSDRGDSSSSVASPPGTRSPDATMFERPNQEVDTLGPH